MPLLCNGKAGKGWFSDCWLLIYTKGKGEQMKAFLILEDGTVFTGTSIGSTRDCISEIVFNTSMTGYLEVLTDPSYAGQVVG